ncbi:MAG: hypothetical protein ACK4RG_07400 [Fimbriimonadales bacterium]
MQGSRWRAALMWLLFVWLSVAASATAMGCLRACERAYADAACCALEVTPPCSDQPCPCKPCPVCSAPAPQALVVKVESSAAVIEVELSLVDLPEIPAAHTPSIPVLPLARSSAPAPCVHAQRAPPVQS